MAIRVIDPDPLKRAAKPTPPGGVLPATRATRPAKFTVVQTRWDSVNFRHRSRTVRSFCASEGAFDARLFLARLRELGHIVVLHPGCSIFS